MCQIMSPLAGSTISGNNVAVLVNPSCGDGEFQLIAEIQGIICASSHIYRSIDRRPFLVTLQLPSGLPSGQMVIKLYKDGSEVDYKTYIYNPLMPLAELMNMFMVALATMQFMYSIAGDILRTS